MSAVSRNQIAAVDKLDEVTDILSFIMDVAPAIAADGCHQGLTPGGATGLFRILDHVQSIIRDTRLLI